MFKLLDELETDRKKPWQWYLIKYFAKCIIVSNECSSNIRSALSIVLDRFGILDFWHDKRITF